MFKDTKCFENRDEKFIYCQILSKRETCNSYLSTSYDKYFTRVLNDAFHFLCCSPFFLLFIYVPFAFLSIVCLSSLVLRKTILPLIFKDEFILIEGNGDVLIQSNVCLSQILSERNFLFQQERKPIQKRSNHRCWNIE